MEIFDSPLHGCRVRITGTRFANITENGDERKRLTGWRKSLARLTTRQYGNPPLDRLLGQEGIVVENSVRIVEERTVCLVKFDEGPTEEIFCEFLTVVGELNEHGRKSA